MTFVFRAPTTRTRTNRSAQRAGRFVFTEPAHVFYSPSQRRGPDGRWIDSAFGPTLAPGTGGGVGGSGGSSMQVGIPIRSRAEMDTHVDERVETLAARHGISKDQVRHGDTAVEPNASVVVSSPCMR